MSKRFLYSIKVTGAPDDVQRLCTALNDRRQYSEVSFLTSGDGYRVFVTATQVNLAGEIEAECARCNLELVSPADAPDEI